MSRGGKLRNRLILLFILATAAPLALTVWTSIELLDRSFGITPVRELDSLSKSFQRLGREYYQRSRDWLKSDAAAGRISPVAYSLANRESWPPEVESFWSSGDDERFATSGEDGKSLHYLRRHPSSVEVFSRELGIGTLELTRDFSQARNAITFNERHDLRRGFVLTFIAVASVVWLAGLLVLVYLARRVTAPVGLLTKGLAAVAAGDLTARVDAPPRQDEMGRAIAAFNHMAAQLQRSRENLIHVTRLSSWQALARKMAHEVKNSLTPIRLTMEEISARSAEPDPEFLRQASQIVVDEVVSLERRVRAFSELAAEPPVTLSPVDLKALTEDRVALLRSAHPGVVFQTEVTAAWAIADADLLKGIVTNLIDNAAHAAREGGVVLVRTAAGPATATLEVHDSGPGLSPHARETIFEPTISFKKGGMGLGLSIARKSALLCRGDIELIDGALGGAAFRVTLPSAPSKPVEQSKGEAALAR